MWKFRLVRGLYERGFNSEDVQKLFRVIDWLMQLKPRVQKRFRLELDQYEEGRSMPFYDAHQQRVMEQMIEDSLRTRFGEAGVKLMPAITDLGDGEKYLALNRIIAGAATLDEVSQACVKAAAPQRKKGVNGSRKSQRDK